MSLSFEIEALRVLAQLLRNNGLSEIQLEEGDRKLRLVRLIPPSSGSAAGAMSHVAPAPAPAAAPAPASASAEAAGKPDPAKHPGAVKSPMVGVAYLSPEPGAPAYVSIGQTVKVGQTVLLIEAMKTFNQIKATNAGTVTQILVKAGAPVEYDEPLLIIE
jgi:acetyl-CoA carboxylase biotin carboxyl carrier protein